MGIVWESLMTIFFHKSPLFGDLENSLQNHSLFHQVHLYIKWSYCHTFESRAFCRWIFAQRNELEDFVTAGRHNKNNGGGEEGEVMGSVFCKSL